MQTTEKPLSIAIVGGVWNLEGGRASSYMRKLGDALMKAGAAVVLHNGGHYNDLVYLLKNEGGALAEHKAIIWLADVPNTLPKSRDVKAVYPTKLLVMGKRNNDEYSIMELVARALDQKANLCIDFRKDDGLVSGRIYDALGAVWLDYTSNIEKLATTLLARLRQLAAFTRQGVKSAGVDALTIPTDESEFFVLIRLYAELFHELIAPVGTVTRFLGNSSFRCNRGFPSMRDATTGQIFMSRRNVDKRYIGPDAFVGVAMEGNSISYWGPYKPSVDTPIQLRLYEALSNIRYMLHAHVYLEGAPFTRTQVPCGALEEVEEILSLIPDKNATFACINLLGHGCIVLADSPEKMMDLSFVSRPSPEYLEV